METLVFRLGLIPLIFLIWAWWDSTRPHTTWATCEVAGYSLNFYDSLSRLYVEFNTTASTGFPKNFSFSREWNNPAYATKSPFGIRGGLLPSPTFVREVPNDPGHILTEEESSRFEKGESSGSLTIPYWVILTLYLIPWLGISRLSAKRRSKLRQAVLLPG